jgi:PAS domain S-box-containing protein
MSIAVRTATETDPLPPAGALALVDETVLSLIRARAALSETLSALCTHVERLYVGMSCSVLLLDSDGVSLRHCAAPSLPEDYIHAIDGVKIGPSTGSCGTAAYRRQPVIVSDIAVDPLWNDYRHLALPHSLRACWSTPIPSQDGTILGTFAVYYREPRSPEARHLQLIAHATHLAGVAIEHDRARAELRAAETRYRTLVERLPAITYVAEMGAEGPWHYVSPQIQSILGFSPAEWLADPRSWINQVHVEDRPIALAAEEQFQRTHELYHAEYRMVARDGRILWFRDEAVLLQQSEGKLLMQGVLYDITEHKRMEDQLRHSQKMEAVGRLAGGVAHDFNNLLMLIQAHNERLRGQLSPAHPAHRDAVEIEHAVARAASLIRQLLAFSRKQVLQPRVLDLNAVLADVAKMLDRLIGTDIALEVTAAPSLWRIKADPGQMEQVILNLAVNARDAMPHGGRLLIETCNAELSDADARRRDGAVAGHHVRLTVRDTGVGMDPGTQARIFEPFFTTKERGKGTGLGLATIYGVVKQSGGWIWVDSQPGEGTKFEIYFPRVEKTQALEPTEPTATVQAATTQGSETILVVEDQGGIRELVDEFLSGKGYVVLSAADGEEALRIVDHHAEPIHLLVTDMVMPNMGGRELAHRLKRVRPQMKVLFMSGYPEHTAVGDEDLNQGTLVLQKPFSLDTLGCKIRTALDQQSSDS